MKPNVPYFTHIWNRAHHYRLNWLQITTGDPGSGKSYSNLTMGELLDPTFNINKVCFTPSEFMDAIDDVRKNGEVVEIDEMGIALSSRKWQSLSNILTNEVIQTFRYKHIIALFAVPDFTYIDSQARKIVQCFCETKRRQMDPTKMWLYYLSHGRQTGKIYFIHPLIKVDGITRAIRHITFKRLPSKELIKEYEEKHQDYKDKLRRKNRALLGMMERKDRPSADTMYEMINKVGSNINEYRNVRGTLDWRLIAGKLHISEPKSKQIKVFIEKEELGKKEESEGKGASGGGEGV